MIKYIKCCNLGFFGKKYKIQYKLITSVIIARRAERVGNMKAQLILENGVRFSGTMFGAERDVVGEVIFTTGMVGYQEVLTDPSYTGQIVTMTFPLIGNYGINSEDTESDNTGLTAIIVREKCDYPSNFRSEMTLEEFMKKNGVVGLYGIDTRALTGIIRENGCMKGVIMKGEPSDDEVSKLLSSLDNSDVILKTTTKEKYTVNENGGTSVAFIDMGVKNKMLDYFVNKNCKVTVYPAFTDAKEIEEQNPDFVFVSNGAGSPIDASKTVEAVIELVKNYPVFGIALGHQIIGLALGAKVEKLKFGHHGSSQPVKDVNSKRVFVTSQNHNYVLCDLPADVEETFINVNDGTCEGIAHKSLKVKGLQFIPDGATGSLSPDFLFDGFVKEDK